MELRDRITAEAVAQIANLLAQAYARYRRVLPRAWRRASLQKRKHRARPRAECRMLRKASIPALRRQIDDNALDFHDSALLQDLQPLMPADQMLCAAVPDERLYEVEFVKRPRQSFPGHVPRAECPPRVVRSGPQPIDWDSFDLHVWFSFVCASAKPRTTNRSLSSPPSSRDSDARSPGRSGGTSTQLGAT